MPVKTAQEDSELFFVKIIRAFPRQRFLEVRCIPFTNRSTAYSSCDDIQEDLDADGDPARAYVTDHTGMPVRAGLAARESARAFLYPQPQIRSPATKSPQFGKRHA